MSWGAESSRVGSVRGKKRSVFLVTGNIVLISARVEAAFVAAASSALQLAASPSAMSPTATEFAFCFSERSGYSDGYDEDDDVGDDYYANDGSGGQYKNYDDYDYSNDDDGSGGRGGGGGGGGSHGDDDAVTYPDYYTSGAPYDHDKIYRDVRYHGSPAVIRNPRDRRNFPGIVPAGIDGISPKLFDFITTHVNQVSYYVQGRRRRRSWPK